MEAKSTTKNQIREIITHHRREYEAAKHSMEENEQSIIEFEQRLKELLYSEVGLKELDRVLVSRDAMILYQVYTNPGQRIHGWAIKDSLLVVSISEWNGAFTVYLAEGSYPTRCWKGYPLSDVLAMRQAYLEKYPQEGK